MMKLEDGQWSGVRPPVESLSWRFLSFSESFSEPSSTFCHAPCHVENYS